MPRLTLLPLAGHPANPNGAPPESCARFVDVIPGTRVLDAASTFGFLIATRCGGIADCLTCRIEVAAGSEQALSPVADSERAALSEAGAPANERLACQARVVADAVVLVPDPSTMEWP